MPSNNGMRYLVLPCLQSCVIEGRYLVTQLKKSNKDRRVSYTVILEEVRVGNNQQSAGSDCGSRALLVKNRAMDRHRLDGLKLPLVRG